MIAKERKKPIKVRKLEALLRRLPSDHLKYQEIEQEWAKSISGYRGEESLDYDLSFLPEQDYIIFHDIRLKGNNHFFQLDTLILCKSFFLIIEAKNISGSLLFDQRFHQLIRTKMGIEEVFPDPILQVKRQALQFVIWLKDNKFPPVPVETLVVVTNPQTRINIIPDDFHLQEKVIRSKNLPDKVEGFKNLHNTELMEKKELRKLSSLLLKHNTPNNPDLLGRYQILESHLLKGVHCPNCLKLSMDRKQGKWICPHCSFSSKDAHLPSLHDYTLLFKSTMTNGEARRFLNLITGSTAHYLLFKLNVPFSGSTKARAYHLPWQE